MGHSQQTDADGRTDGRNATYTVVCIERPITRLRADPAPSASDLTICDELQAAADQPSELDLEAPAVERWNWVTYE